MVDPGTAGIPGNLPPPGVGVTIRHRVPDPGSGPADRPLLADVVGTVLALDGERIVVRRGDGSPVSVRRDRITAARRLPGPPGAGRTPDPLMIERLAVVGWPAVETASLGGWLLRASGGWTRRANSALVLGPADRPPEDAAAACRAWYAARGLVARVSVAQVPPLRGLLPAAVAAEQEHAPTTVLIARSADVLAALDPTDLAGGPVVVTALPGPAWLGDYRDAATHPAAMAVLTGPQPPARVRFADFPTATGLAARGRGVTLDGWVGLTAIGVHPEHRRRGIGRLLTAVLLADGLRHGGVRTYVQVDRDNAAGIAFWQRIGYRRSHDSAYYRLRDGDIPAGDADG